MDRRRLLVSAGITLSSSLAGCLDDGNDLIQSVSLSEPTVEQGETAIISVEAPDLAGLYIGEFPDEFPAERLTLGDSTFTPAPDAVFESMPPHWEFTGEDVVGEVPIETSQETPPGAYRFIFDVRMEGEDEIRHVPVTVTVEAASK